jgi:hypothetical protein
MIRKKIPYRLETTTCHQKCSQIVRSANTLMEAAMREFTRRYVANIEILQ